MERLRDGCLAGTTILFMGPSTFGYEKAIVDAIQSLGGAAVYVDERPGNDFLTKGIIRVNPELIRRRIERYYSSELARIGPADEVRKVLVISPEALGEASVRSIRSRFPRAELILYMWDSIRNKAADIRGMLPLFDRALSFDREDCAEFPEMSFRPLFFLPQFEAIPSVEEPRYDIVFVGTIHSDRYAVCRRVAEAAERMGLRMYQYLFLNDKKLYWYQRATNRHMRASKASDFSYVPLPREEVLGAFRDTRCLLDVQHPKQVGLTMRTIEALGARRKLLTTNPTIYDYDFFSDENISVINRADIDFSRNFVVSPGRDIAPDVYFKYSIRGWIKDVLALE